MSGARVAHEEGEPISPLGSDAGIALGAWTIVFEALGATVPHEHMLHHAGMLGTVREAATWAPMVERVAKRLSENGIDRRKMQQQQYITKEGRSHLLQSAILRTAKHVGLDPGDWSPFSPTLERWLRRPSAEGEATAAAAAATDDSLVRHLVAMLQPLSVHTSLIAASPRFSPRRSPATSAVGVRSPTRSEHARTLQSLGTGYTAPVGSQVTSDVGLSKLKAQLAQAQAELAAEKQRASSDVAEAAVLSEMRARLQEMRSDLERHPVLEQQKLSESEVEWASEVEFEVRSRHAHTHTHTQTSSPAHPPTQPSWHRCASEQKARRAPGGRHRHRHRHRRGRGRGCAR
jgi:hypothetical protein